MTAQRTIPLPSQQPLAQPDQILAGNMVMMPDLGPAPISSVLNTSP
jgi:hypothetical protein